MAGLDCVNYQARQNFLTLSEGDEDLGSLVVSAVSVNWVTGT
jgi:hypothetical protein